MQCSRSEEKNQNNISMKKVIRTNQAPAAIGPYSQAIQNGNMLFISGQLGIDPTTGEFVKGGVNEQTSQVFKNIKAILSEAGFTMDDIVKTTVFLADMAYFATFNEVYASQFETDFPARSAFAVKTLPKDGLVEIEVIAIRC
jgi:2-iminobutanoate/2-iminopropanoate deaminase